MPRFGETIFYPFFVELHRTLKAHIASGATFDDLVDEFAGWQAEEDMTWLEDLGEEGLRERVQQLDRMDPSVLEPILDTSFWDDPDAVLAEIRCPAHLLAGQYDLGGAMEEDDVVRTVSKIPHCTHTIFSDVGHSIHKEKPQEYVEELRAFLETLP
jgi:pimeloyl-ACP methyl ester carboxylesterase